MRSRLGSERDWPGWWSRRRPPVALAVPWVGAEANGGGHGHDHGDDSGKLLFFASDGLRQDAVEQYADDGDTPGFRELLRNGTQGVRQRPADAGAAEHRRGLVHAHHRRVAGRARARPTTRSTSTARRSATRTRGVRRPSVLQAETLAQAAERGGKKVAQIEWAGGRSGTINGPTLDYRSFRLRPRRGDQLHRARPTTPALHAVLRAAVRPPGRVRRQRARSRRPRPTRRDRLDRRARAPTARPRRCACASSTRGVDKYGLNAYLYDIRNDRKTRYDRVLLQPHQERRRQGRRPRGGRVGRRQGQDRPAARSTARPARS